MSADRLDAQNMDTTRQVPPFIESELRPELPARCVDGREAPESLLGPELLGGSIHPILLSAITEGAVFDKPFVLGQAKKLTEAGIKLGAHRGSHYDPAENRSDCGFADRPVDIMKTALTDREAITEALKAFYEQYSDSLPENLTSVVADGFNVLGGYSLDNIQLSGDELVKTIEEAGGTIENVKGEHQEEAAYVDIKKGVTFDTKRSNEGSRQAFNLDIMEAVNQAHVLGVDPNVALGLSTVLYAATEKVLVEQKGKPALPIVLHSK